MWRNIQSGKYIILYTDSIKSGDHGDARRYNHHMNYTTLNQCWFNVDQSTLNQY